MNLILQTPPLPLKADDDGVIRVGGSRVSLDTIILSFKNGSTAEQIAHDYPVVDLADVYGVINYYLRHEDEVEQYFVNQREQGEQIQHEMEKRFDPQGIRDRLLARREQRD